MLRNAPVAASYRSRLLILFLPFCSLTMSTVPIPIQFVPQSGSPPLSSSSSSSSLWDRVSTWASENKAIVYTIAGTAVVITGAGIVYYLSESRKNNTAVSISEEKRKSKKERRKEKKAAEDGKSATSSVKDEEAGTAAHVALITPADLCRDSATSSKDSHSRSRRRAPTDRRDYCRQLLSRGSILQHNPHVIPLTYTRIVNHMRLI